MCKKYRDIEIHMGPRQLGAPDDLEEAIIKFIDGAAKSLDIAVQELRSKPITVALIRARQERRVEVRIPVSASTTCFVS